MLYNGVNFYCHLISVSYICNKSILCVIFRDSWKLSIIKPMYKEGDRMNATDYRPISLLTLS